MNNSIFRSWFTVVTAALISLILVACGGGSGGGSASSGTGTVALLMTDGPADDFDEVNLTVTRAELFCDNGHITVFEGNRRFNLLNLASDGRVFALERVPVGSCSKIRLTLTQIELIQRDEGGNIILQEFPKLPGNGKLDLNPRGEFYIAPGATLLIQIDVDADKSIFEKSIHVVETGSGKFQFRPVVFVDIISDAFPGKMTRVHGVIGEVYGDNQEFELCRIEDEAAPLEESEPELGGCIEVAVVDATSIFGQDGRPIGFGGLVPGEEATVFGWLHRDNDDNDNGKDRILDDLELVALVIELGPEGTFQKIKGTAQSVVDETTAQFILLIDPGQGIIAENGVVVQLQEGTKIINRQGELLGPDAIQPGVAMKVNGVLDISDEPDVLYAAFIVIDVEGASLQRISGTMGANPDNSCGLTIQTDTGDRSVEVAGAHAFLVTDGSSSLVEISTISSGQVDIYGREGLSGCFDAELVIAFEMEE
jgi:hypothetical protein